MKAVLVLLVTLMVSAAAQAAECKLSRPIPFSGSVVGDRYLSAVQTDQAPKFLRPENSEGRLAMALFEMSNMGRPTQLVGAKLGLSDGGQYVGFSNGYSGATEMEGGIETAAGGVKLHWSRVSVVYGDANGIPAVHELKLGVRGSEIVSVEFTHPVFEITGTDGPYTYIRFTGENQVLCVNSAR